MLIPRNLQETILTERFPNDRNVSEEKIKVRKNI